MDASSIPSCGIFIVYPAPYLLTVCVCTIRSKVHVSSGNYIDASDAETVVHAALFMSQSRAIDVAPLEADVQWQPMS
jgi:hypothetical protein